MKDQTGYDPIKAQWVEAEYKASSRASQLDEALRALIRQIEMGDFTDTIGHKLTNNVHFIAAKEAVGG